MACIDGKLASDFLTSSSALSLLIFSASDPKESFPIDNESERRRAPRPSSLSKSWVYADKRLRSDLVKDTTLVLLFLATSKCMFFLEDPYDEFSF